MRTILVKFFGIMYLITFILYRNATEYRKEVTNIVVTVPADFREKMFSHILGTMTRKLLNVLGFFKEMLVNLFGNLIIKLSDVFEKLIDKRIVFGNLIGKLPSMFENQIGRIHNMFVNLPNEFSNKFEILRGMFGYVRNYFGSDSGCTRYRIGKIGSERILCSM